MKRILSILLTFIFTFTMIGSQAFAKGTSNDIEEYNFNYENDAYKVQKSINGDYLRVYINGKLTEDYKLTDFMSKLNSDIKKIKDSANKISESYVTPQVALPPGGGGLVWTRQKGDSRGNIYKIADNAPRHDRFIQVITWGYEDTYGASWKYAYYEGNNCAYLDNFKSACDSWYSARSFFVATGIAWATIAYLSSLGRISSAQMSAILVALGLMSIGASATSLISNGISLCTQNVLKLII